MDAAFPAGTGVPPTEVLKSLPGLEFLQRIIAGELPAPPISATLGYRLASVERGSATFAATPGPHLYNPLGSIHGGFALTLLDSCMSCAVQTMLEAGFGYTTLEVKTSFIRGMTHETGEIRAIGTAQQVGRRAGFAEGRIVDAAGRLLAHGTTTCLIFAV